MNQAATVSSLEEAMHKTVIREVDGMYNIQDIINWFLSRQAMSPKKLQKMLYYAYAWTLTLMNENEDELNTRLFDAKFEAWVHGPVVKSVYDKYKENGSQEIPKLDTIYEMKDNDEIVDILEQVMDIYGGFNGNQLENITHQEEPWKNARKDLQPYEATNNVIPDKDMFRYYIQRTVETDAKE